MLAVLALGAFEKLFNRWIDLDAATRIGFNQLTGKLLRVVVVTPTLAVDVFFDNGAVRINPTALGMPERSSASVFEQRPYDKQYAPQQADTTLQVNDLVALFSLLGSLNSNSSNTSGGNLPIQGDITLLQQLQRILANAQPDISYALAPLVGDNLAAQIASVLHHGKQAVQKTVTSISAHSTEWIQEDIGLAGKWQMDTLKAGVQDLKLEIERLNAKLAQFSHSAPSTSMDPVDIFAPVAETATDAPTPEATATDETVATTNSTITKQPPFTQ